MLSKIELSIIISLNHSFSFSSYKYFLQHLNIEINKLVSAKERDQITHANLDVQFTYVQHFIVHLGGSVAICVLQY